jgi:sulfopyruvate decarboxylase subunit alpha
MSTAAGDRASLAAASAPSPAAVRDASPAALIVEHLKRAGIGIVASLPDQWLKGLIERCAADPAIRHVSVAREDEGVGIAAGAFLGGAKAALVCQNSAVLLAVNALGGMAFHHQVPFLVIAAHRGGHDDNQYYQMYKGRLTEPVLAVMGLPYHVVDRPEDLGRIEDAARQAWLCRLPVVVLLRRRALVAG